MSLGTTTDSAAGAKALLDDPRYELLPFDSFHDQIEHVPEGSKVAITASPDLGLERTLEITEEYATAEYELIPHISARSVRDVDHLDEIAGRMRDAGVADLFVPGGDNKEPAGEFESSYQLLEALDDLEYEFEEIGVGGYPEGHEFIDDATLWDALEKKEPYATYVITQICYEPDAVIDWIDEVRQRGIDLSVEVGVPGVMKYQRLLQISREVGVGDSINFLRKTSGVVGFIKQLVGSRGKYTPDDLVEGVGEYATDDHYDITGSHLYTFNQVRDTEEWRQDVLRR